MKTLSLPYATNRALRNTGRQHESTQYQDAVSVLIVFTSDGTDRKFQMIRKLHKEFQRDGKKVSFLYLLHKYEDRPSVGLDEGMVAVEKKNIGYFGEIKDEEVNKLMEKEYDFLINADLDSNIYTDLLVAKCHSKCKIGRYLNTNDKLFDFLIQLEDDCDQDFYLDQIYHYTKLF